METQTFLYWRAHGCQLHLYKEVFYADSDIFLCISCAQNKLELAGVGYPNLFSLLSHGQVVQAWDGSHALLELWHNWGWKEAWEVSSPVSCSKQQNFKIRSGCWEPCLVKCRISSFINNWKAECLTINFFFFFILSEFLFLQFVTLVSHPWHCAPQRRVCLYVFPYPLDSLKNSNWLCP